MRNSYTQLLREVQQIYFRNCTCIIVFNFDKVLHNALLSPMHKLNTLKPQAVGCIWRNKNCVLSAEHFSILTGRTGGQIPSLLQCPTTAISVAGVS